MAAYLSIIIAFIIALVGVIAKTEKNYKKKHLINLNGFGILMLILVILSSIVAIWAQYVSNVEDDAKKLVLENNIKSERLRQIHDSMIAENRYTNQAYRLQQTIDQLNKQRQIDSLQLRTDSSNFLVTLGKFQEQLDGQHRTLDNITKLLHPIFPLRIQCELKIYGKDFPDEFRKILIDFDTVIAHYWQLDRSKFPSDLAFEPNTKSIFFKAEDYKKQSSFKRFYRYRHTIVYNTIYPNIENSIFPKQEIASNDTLGHRIEAAMIKFIPEWLYFNIRNKKDEERLSIHFRADNDGEMYYEYDKANDCVTINLHREITSDQIDMKNIFSMDECDRDTLIVGLSKNFQYTNYSVSQPSVLNFYCGGSFNNSYTFLLKPPSLLSVGSGVFGNKELTNYKLMIDLKRIKNLKGSYWDY